MKLVNYIKDCAREMKRVSWPSGKDVAHTTRVVLVSTVIVAIVLGLVDWALLSGALALFGR